MESLSLIPVRYAETDRMGVVHHSHYPVYFEQGRTDFFLAHLMAYSHFEEQGLFAPVLSLNLEILGRATYGDTLQLRTRADWMKGVRLQMSYSISVLRGGDPLQDLPPSVLRGGDPLQDLPPSVLRGGDPPQGTAVARGHTVHALVGPAMKVVNPRHFGTLFDRLRQVFP